MCGIVGYISNTTETDILLMMDKISHRGPDDFGHVVIDERVHLGHRRLSIQDLSSAGAQPMFSHDGRYAIVYNGEIYNFTALKDSLQRKWQGHSDTEVLLEAISEWGLVKALQRCSGMFAFALYDKFQKKLFLVRDRFGEKPLYYAKMGKNFLFASELKAFSASPLFKKNLNQTGVSTYFKYGFIPAPNTIYENTFKLFPGCMLEIDPDSLDTKETIYWKLETKQTFMGSFEDACSLFKKKLEDVVRNQIIADVPVGSFLSGGIDSSLVTAVMSQVSSQKIRTFSVGFNEEKFNEATFAREVAKTLGSEHTEIILTPEDALKIVPKLGSIYDEPFGDISQIPTALISHVTKKHVTVALSGDGGDEIFGGYNRYLTAPKIFKNSRIAPDVLRNLGSRAIKSIPPSVWDSFLPFPNEKVFKIAGVLEAINEEDVYQRLLTHWKNAPLIMKTDPSIIRFDQSGLSFEERMMLTDIGSYLPDDILVKVDRAGMSCSLETRIPFLDHELAEFAWSLPLEFKIYKGKGKRLLRETLKEFIPVDLFDRPKKGFEVPLDNWLREDLREWAEALLSRDKIQSAGVLDVSQVERIWKEHLSGKRNWQQQLWDVLMFQDWYENSFIR